MHRTIETLLAGACLHAAAFAADVFVVAETGGDFTELQSAIDAAASGDVILIRRDFVQLGAVIDGKAVHVVADLPGGVFHVEHLDLDVRNTPAGTTTVLRGVRMANTGGVHAAIEIVDCDGHVSIEDVVAVGLAGQMAVLVATPGRPALVVRDSASVAVHSSSFTGGRGFDTCLGCLEYGIPLPATAGGPGATATNSRISAHDTTFVGGHSGALLSGQLIAGGPGLVVTGGSALLSGSTACAGAGPGDGLVIAGAIAFPAILHDSIFEAGPNGGAPIVAAPGATQIVAAPARRFALGSPARSQQNLPAEFDGEPGDFVFVALGAQGATLLAPPLVGWLGVGLPLLSVVPVGVLPAPDGILAFAALVPDLPPAIEAVPLHLQPWFVSAGVAIAGPSTSSILLPADG